MSSIKRILAAALALILMASCTGALADTLTLPRRTQIIDAMAFYQATGLDRVVVPEGVTEIRAKAFAGSSLTSVSLPGSITYIADDAFDGCSRLTDVTAPLDSYAFQWAFSRGLIGEDGIFILPTNERGVTVIPETLYGVALTLQEDDALRYRLVAPGKGTFIIEDGGSVGVSADVIITNENGGVVTDPLDSTPARVRVGRKGETLSVRVRVNSRQSGGSVVLRVGFEAAPGDAVTALRLAPTSLTLIVGGSALLTDTVTPATADQSVAFTSSDEAVAYVDPRGYVFGLAAGTATITATAGNPARTATCAVTVTAPARQELYSYIGQEMSDAAEALNLVERYGAENEWFAQSDTLSLLAENGETNRLEALYLLYDKQGVYSLCGVMMGMTDAQAESTLTAAGWQKFDSDVNTRYFVRPYWGESASELMYYTIAPSTGKVNEVAATRADVLITDTYVGGLTLSAHTAALEVGQTLELEAQIDPPEAVSTALTWQSSDPAVATVEAGVVRAIAPGTATITATASDRGIFSDTCQITVTRARVDWVNYLGISESDLKAMEYGFHVEDMINEFYSADGNVHAMYSLDSDFGDGGIEYFGVDADPEGLYSMGGVTIGMSIAEAEAALTAGGWTKNTIVSDMPEIKEQQTYDYFTRYRADKGWKETIDFSYKNGYVLIMNCSRERAGGTFGSDDDDLLNYLRRPIGDIADQFDMFEDIDGRSYISSWIEAGYELYYGSQARGVDWIEIWIGGDDMHGYYNDYYCSINGVRLDQKRDETQKILSQKHWTIDRPTVFTNQVGTDHYSGKSADGLLDLTMDITYEKDIVTRIRVSVEAHRSYRALVLGFSEFDDEDFITKIVNNIHSPKSADNFVKLLSARAPGDGDGSDQWDIRLEIDMTEQQIFKKLETVAQLSTDDDVFFFSISTHGVWYTPDKNKPDEVELALYTKEGQFRFNDLADKLMAIKGQVIVMLDTCYSGFAIYDGDPPCKIIDHGGDEKIAINYGSLRTDRFHVITAERIGYESLCGKDGSAFSNWLLEGIGTSGDMPADSNGDGILTFIELGRFGNRVFKMNDAFGIGKTWITLNPRFYSSTTSFPLFRK